ncbi:MAG: formate dehydrogenase accessory sulfurtransferase FdhD [Pseudomonadota bacterium]
MTPIPQNPTEPESFDKMLDRRQAVYLLPDTTLELDRELIREEPLSINVQGKTFAVVMRTPGDEKAHAAGFCLAEGLADTPSDLADIALCDGEESNVAAVRLTPERAKKVASILEKQGYMSQTSCGICGREIIEDLGRILRPAASTLTLSFAQAMGMADALKDSQQLRRRCFSSHAVAIFNSRCEKISEAEDAGRHNALDKAIGKLFLQGTIGTAAVALLSSRASYEMIQKCARARIEIVISMSRPTALAADLGQSLNMTLASVRDNGIYVFTGRERIMRS